MLLPMLLGQKMCHQKSVPVTQTKIRQLMNIQITNTLIALLVSGVLPYRFSTKTDTTISGEFLNWNQNKNTLIVRFEKEITSKTIYIQFLTNNEFLELELEVKKALLNKKDLVCSIVKIGKKESLNAAFPKCGLKVAIPSLVTVKDKKNTDKNLKVMKNIVLLEDNKLYVEIEDSSQVSTEKLKDFDAPLLNNETVVGEIKVQGYQMFSTNCMILSGDIKVVQGKDIYVTCEEFLEQAENTVLRMLEGIIS